MGWLISESADEFLDRAGDFLRAAPVENTMPLTLARTLQERGPHAYGRKAPIFGWFTTGGGAVEGAFLQTPPHPLLLTGGRLGPGRPRLHPTPELRGHGYAAAVTAAVTRAALDAGADDVVLFTDITNQTSNALYERLGYRPVEDRTVWEFG